MSIKINLGAWNSVFAIPSQVVDEGLKYSDGVKLKVLLYILRNSGTELSEDSISKATGVNVTDIPEAVDYWVSLGILQKDGAQLMPPQAVKEELPQKTVERTVEKTVEQPLNNSANENTTINSFSKNIEENTQKAEEVPQKQTFTVTRPQKPDYVFTSQQLAVDEELKILVNEAQLALGKTLSNSDISTLLMLKDTCGLPLDVLLMLIQYCISIDKANVRTVEKIGIQWADAGIYSVEAADNKIRQTKMTSRNFSIISSAFGLKNVGSPTSKQLEFGDKWVGEWKFSPEMLRTAYERCVDTKGTMNLRYIDGILKRWNANNIRNLDELQKFEKAGTKNNYKQNTSYDIDELEKIDTLDNF